MVNWKEFLGLGGIDEARSDEKLAEKKGDDALQAFERLRSEGRPVTDMPAQLLDEVGNIYRDLGRTERAVALYAASAASYVSDEAWTGAEHMVRKAEKLLGERNTRLWRLSLQVALGRGEHAEAGRCLVALGRRLTPSDGDEIEHLVEIIDREGFGDPRVDLALSEMLTALGRPGWAVERLKEARQGARRRGLDDVLDEIDRRIELAGARADRRDEEGPDDAEAPPEVPMPPTPEPPYAPATDAPATDASAPASPPAGPPSAPAADADPAADASGGEGVADDGPEADPSEVEDSFVQLADLIRQEQEGDGRGETRFVGSDSRAVTSSDDEQVADLVRQLQAGIRETVPEDEAQTHYDLGISFLEMEMYDQAVESFQTAWRSPEFRRRSAEGLARGLLGRGDAGLARRAAFEALEQLDADDGDVLGLLYWQARAAEAMGRAEEAADLYERICMHDMKFEDAHDRLHGVLSGT